MISIWLKGSGVISGGMIPKVDASIEALKWWS